MKHSVITALLLASTIAPAAAKTVWQGDVFITAATAACAAVRFDVNDFFRAVYRPRNISDNGPNTSLALFGARHAGRITVTNDAFATGRPYSGVFLSSRAGQDDWNGTLGPTTVTVVTATTAVANVKIQLNNFDGAVGCTVSLQGALTRRPD